MMDQSGQELLEKNKRELLFSVENGLRCWPSSPTDEQREETQWE